MTDTATVVDDDRLTTFQQHTEDMRNMIMCKICLKPLYEPFILACGHTYCYGCLRSWFSGLDHRRRKKNCPDCRSEVKLSPAPNYILRDLVHMFISRTELLPEDETTEEHEVAKKVEAALLTSDRDGRGLFEGAFKRPTYGLPLPDRMIDHIDGVERCPHCFWELEEGECFQCGWSIDGLDTDFSDEDLESSTGGLSTMNEGLSDASDYDSMDGLPPPHFYGAGIAVDNSSMNEDSDAFSGPDYRTPNPYGVDEDVDEMSSFIDDDDDDEDEPNEADEDDLGYIGHTPNLPRARRIYEIPDDEEDEEENERGDEDDDDGPDTAPNGMPWNRRANSWRGHTAPTAPEEASDSEDHSDDTVEQRTNYDESSDHESRSDSPLPVAPVPRRRLVVVSDDEDQDNSRDPTPSADDQDKSEVIEPQENEDTDSDDTAIPPQPSASRRQRLVTQRARRNTPSAWRALARSRNDELTSRTQRRNYVGAN